MHNTCTHRGGSLGNGTVVGDCIQCPYHGWKFNGSGDCERIPSLGPLDKVPQRARIDADPVEGRYGLGCEQAYKFDHFSARAGADP